VSRIFAPGMMYLGRAGPSKTIELTSLSVSLVGAEEEGGEGLGVRNTSGRIGPSKMSTHSLTFSVLDDLGVCDVEGALIRVGEMVEEVRGITWACLEIEDE